MIVDKKAINYYSSFYEVSKELTKEQFYEFNMAIYKVMFFEEHIDNITFDSQVLNIVWKSVRHSLKASVEGYCTKKNISYDSMFKGGELDILPPYQAPYQQEKEKEKEKEEEKEKDAHTPVSSSKNLKTENKQEINPDLKNLINANKPKGENQVMQLIKFYRENISGKNEDVQEQASYNQILLKNHELEKMLLGLRNYARYLKVSKKTPIKLFFFIRDGIYVDYQNENVVSTGKNIALVPADLVGKTFVVEGENIKFENDGYVKIDKDWKVTNAKNVEDMVKLIRGAA